MDNDYRVCAECEQPRSHPLHDETAHDTSERDINQLNYDCGYEASWEGEERGWVANCDHHEYEPEVNHD
tara:strand:+ start:357 stop:563 length:207 start_codon:yes stop_codon:yes gene_type:complete